MESTNGSESVRDGRPCFEKLDYGDQDSQFVERYHTKDARYEAVLIHGGYWRQRYGLDLMHGLVPMFLKQNACVTNIEYRRIGESGEPWTNMAADVEAALSVEPTMLPRIVVGHSAGGQLALWSAAQPFGVAAAVIALAPVSDLVTADELKLSDHVTKELFSTSKELNELGQEELARDERRLIAASPYHILPLGVKQWLVHGSIDEDVPHQMSDVYAQRAKELRDDVEYLSLTDIDHMSLIDPTASFWPSVLNGVDSLIG